MRGVLLVLLGGRGHRAFRPAARRVASGRAVGVRFAAGGEGGGAVFARTKESIPDGVCAVYKPPGWSSADVVAKVRTTLERSIRSPGEKRQKVKVGHGGTLDPLARGVLVVGVGKGCKAMHAYLGGSKRYRAAPIGAENTGDSRVPRTRALFRDRMFRGKHPHFEAFEER